VTILRSLLQVLQQFLPVLQQLIPWFVGLAVILLLRYLGSQLQHPSGWLGRDFMAPLFNSGNPTLLDACLKCLAAKSGDRVADIGFGGGYAIDQLIPVVRPERPIGVDVSEMMVEVATERWDDRVEVYLAAASDMPLSSGTLDAVLTVNTIYFWSDPVTVLKEIRRVLKPTGRLVIGVRKASFLRLLPITWFRFRYYSEARLTTVLAESGFDTRFEEGGGGLIAIATPRP